MTRPAHALGLAHQKLFLCSLIDELHWKGLAATLGLCVPTARATLRVLAPEREATKSGSRIFQLVSFEFQSQHLGQDARQLWVKALLHTAGHPNTQTLQQWTGSKSEGSNSRNVPMTRQQVCRAKRFSNNPSRGVNCTDSADDFADGHVFLGDNTTLIMFPLPFLTQKRAMGELMDTLQKKLLRPAPRHCGSDNIIERQSFALEIESVE